VWCGRRGAFEESGGRGVEIEVTARVIPPCNRFGCDNEHFIAFISRRPKGSGGRSLLRWPLDGRGRRSGVAKRERLGTVVEGRIPRRLERASKVVSGRKGGAGAERRRDVGVCRDRLMAPRGSECWPCSIFALNHLLQPAPKVRRHLIVRPRRWIALDLAKRRQIVLPTIVVPYLPTVHRIPHRKHQRLPLDPRQQVVQPYREREPIKYRGRAVHVLACHLARRLP